MNNIDTLSVLCAKNTVLIDEESSVNIIGCGNPDSKNVIFLETLRSDDESDLLLEMVQSVRELINDRETKFNYTTFDLLARTWLKSDNYYEYLQNIFGKEFLSNYFLTFSNRSINTPTSTQIIETNKVWNKHILESAKKVIAITKPTWFQLVEDEEIRKTIASGRVLEIDGIQYLFLEQVTNTANATYVKEFMK